jgi:hypothetical protein
MRHPLAAPERKNLASHHTPQENKKVRRRKDATGADCSHLRHADTPFLLMSVLSFMMILRRLG